MCLGVRTGVGYAAIVGCLGMCVFLFWIAAAGGRPQLPGFQEPALGVRRAIARYGLYGVGMWRGFMVE